MDIASWVQGCGVPPLPPLVSPERSSVAAVVRARQASAYVARATCLGGDVVEMRLVESRCVRAWRRDLSTHGLAQAVGPR